MAWEWPWETNEATGLRHYEQGLISGVQIVTGGLLGATNVPATTRLLEPFSFYDPGNVLGDSRGGFQVPIATPVVDWVKEKEDDLKKFGTIIALGLGAFFLSK